MHAHQCCDYGVITNETQKTRSRKKQNVDSSIQTNVDCILFSNNQQKRQTLNYPSLSKLKDRIKKQRALCSHFGAQQQLTERMDCAHKAMTATQMNVLIHLMKKTKCEVRDIPQCNEALSAGNWDNMFQTQSFLMASLCVILISGEGIFNVSDK